jgi:formiminotetrahydrofolate cyclodeaminase
VAIQNDGAPHTAGGGLNGVHHSWPSAFAEIGHALDERRRRQRCWASATYHQAALNHPDSHSILSLSVGELLERLGSSDPAPGGGAAAAMAAALGAALVQMTANLTIGRPRLADVEDHARSIATRAGELRQRLAELADADAAAFMHVSAAYRLPRGDDAQKAARSAAIQAALQVAARVPLDTARACADALEVAEEAAPILNSAVISDVLVGALLARAGLESAALNVEVNLAAMTDANAVARLSEELQRARSGAAERVARVLDAGQSRLRKKT